MKLDITEEEREFLLRVCSRAKEFAKMNILKHVSCIDADKDLIQIQTLIDKLEIGF